MPDRSTVETKAIAQAPHRRSSREHHAPGLVDPERLAVESLPDAERRSADYGTGQSAPSVVTLNAMAGSHAFTQIVFALTGLNQQSDVLHLGHRAHRVAQIAGEVRRDHDCPVCGTDSVRV